MEDEFQTKVMNNTEKNHKTNNYASNYINQEFVKQKKECMESHKCYEIICVVIESCDFHGIK